MGVIFDIYMQTINLPIEDVNILHFDTLTSQQKKFLLSKKVLRARDILKYNAKDFQETYNISEGFLNKLKELFQERGVKF